MDIFISKQGDSKTSKPVNSDSMLHPNENTDEWTKWDYFLYYLDKFLSFWVSVFVKVVITFTSVKVWGLFSILYVSVRLLKEGYIEGGDFATIITVTWSTIFAMREVFKTGNLRYLKSLGVNPSAIGGQHE